MELFVVRAVFAKCSEQAKITKEETGTSSILHDACMLWIWEQLHSWYLTFPLSLIDTKCISYLNSNNCYDSVVGGGGGVGAWGGGVFKETLSPTGFHIVICSSLFPSDQLSSSYLLVPLMIKETEQVRFFFLQNCTVLYTQECV